MADDQNPTTSDDVYDDPDNILADTDDTVEGAVELPKDEQDDLSQSIYNPELNGDPRGSLDLSNSDPEDYAGVSRDNGLDAADGDADHPGDVNPADEQDGTEA